MSSFVVECPFCNKDVTIQSEYANQQLACPLCQNIFTAPPAPAVQAPAVQIKTQPQPVQKPSLQPPVIQRMPPNSAPRFSRSYTGSSYSSRKYNSGGSVNGLLVIIVVAAIAVGVYFGVQKLIKEGDAKLIKPDSTETVNAAKFSEHIESRFYQNALIMYGPRTSCSFIAADIHHVSGNQYEGEVELDYKGRTFKRKFKGTVNGNNFEGDIQVDYLSNPSYIFEDVEMLYNDLKAKNNWAGWNLYSTAKQTSVSGNTVSLSVGLKNSSSGQIIYRTFYITQKSMSNIVYGIN